MKIAKAHVQEYADLVARMRAVVGELRCKSQDETPCDDFHIGYKLGIKSAATKIEAALSPPTENDRNAEEMDTPQEP